METSQHQAWLALMMLLMLRVSETCDIGVPSPSSYTAVLGTDTDLAYFLEGYPSTCCGKLENWQFHATALGYVKTQLWRNISGTNYRLIAEENVTVNAIGMWAPTPGSAVDVEVGDVIGWESIGTETIPHNTGSAERKVQSVALGSVPVGNQAAWGLTPVTNKTYAFGAVVSNDVPDVSDSDNTLPDSSPSGTVVTTVAVTDADTSPITELNCTLETHASFTLDSTTHEIKTVGTVPAGDYTLEVVCMDRCGLFDSATATITITSVGPVIVGLPATYSPAISDSVDTAMPLHSFSVTDSDPVNCSTSNTKFTVDPLPAPDFNIGIANGADLNFDTTPTELVAVECTDGSSTATATLTVPIFDEASVMTGLPGSSTTDDEIPIGTSVHVVTVTDSDDTLDCLIVGSPEDTLFRIVETPPTYLIETDQLLNYDMATSHTINFQCTEDDATPTDVSGTYTLTLTDKPPVLTGLPGTASVNDGVQTAAILGAFTATDGNDQATLTCLTSDPARFDVTGTPPAMNVETVNGATLASTESPIVITLACGDGNTNVTGIFTVIVGNTGPNFVGGVPGTSDPLSDDTVTAKSIGKFSVSDPDPVNCLITAPATPPCEIKKIAATDPQVFEVWTKTGLTEDDLDYDDNIATAGDFDLTFDCDDSVNPVITGNMTVDITDAPLVLAGLPGTPYSSLSDGTTTEMALDSFTVDDSDDLSRIVCDINAAYKVSTTNDFEIRPGTPGKPQDMVIWVKDNPTQLDASTTPSYDLPIECTDGVNPVVTGIKTINIINAPPVFADLPASSTHPTNLSDALNTTTLLRTFSVTDNNVVSCDATAPAPYENDFFIGGTSPDFELYVDGTNQLHYDVDNTITVKVRCTDGATNITADYIINLDDEPLVIAGLPGTDYDGLSDATTAATKIDEFTVTDQDDTADCQVDPTDVPANRSFEVRGAAPTFEIWLRDDPGLDSSVISSYNITFECTDGVNTVYGYKVVNLQNSPPKFQNMPFEYSSIQESLDTETTVHTVKVDDTIDLYCYIADTIQAQRVLTRKKTNGPPTTEYDIIVQQNPKIDFETSGGSIIANFTCEDEETAISELVTININNDPPSIINPTGSATIDDGDSTPRPLHRIELKDFDKDSNCGLTDADGGSFDVTNNVIEYLGNPPVDFEDKPNFNIKFECIDDAGEATPGTFTVTVQNLGPDINNTETFVEIYEHETVPRAVLSLTTTEPINSCAQTTSETDFIYKLDPGTKQPIIFFEGGKVLDHDTRDTIPFTVHCKDDSGQFGSPKTIQIRVLKNKDPSFTNIKGNPITTIEVEAKATMEDDTIFTAESEDPEDDDVTYHLLGCDPSDIAGCPFKIEPNTGKIVATKNLDTHTEHRHTLTIQLNDTYNTPPPKRLIVKIKDPNTKPQWRSLPEYLGVREDRPVGHVIHKITRGRDFTDPDKADTIEHKFEFLDGGEEFFAGNPTTGDITVIKELDFETNPTEFHILVTANDGHEDSEPREVKIRINDFNEKPEFDKTSYTIIYDEGKAEDLVGCPGFIIKDEDGNDYHDLTMACPKGFEAFVMDKETGCVRMSKEWDLDAANKRKGLDSFTCPVKAKDSGKLEADTMLTIKIKEKDDNPPVPDQTQYTHCAPVGSTSSGFSVSSTDNDVLTEHKDPSYEVIPRGLVSVDSNGRVTVGDVSSYSVGKSFKRTLRVTDAAGNSKESLIEIVVCDPPPVVNTNNNNNNNNNNNAAASSTVNSNETLYWLIPALLLSALMAGLSVFLCWKCWRNGKCNACCKSRPKPPKVNRVRQTPPKRAPTPPSPARPRTPLTPPPPPPPKPVQGRLVEVQLPITYHWARNVGNVTTVTG